MRIDGDGTAIHELTLLLTPEETGKVIGVLQQLLRVVPSEQPISENELDDAPRAYEGGGRIVRLVVYADPEAEGRHDAKFASS